MRSLQRSSLVLGMVLAALAGGWPAVAQQGREAAERNSFREVSKNLDPFGNLFVYLSTEQVMGTIDEVVATLEPVLKTTVDKNAVDAKGREQGKAAVGMIRKFYDDCGVREVSGFGVSSIAVEQGVYRNKLFIHHYPDDNKGKLWKLFGKAPHDLTSLGFLPETTAAAAFYDLDLPLLWEWQNRLFMQSGSPSLIVDYTRVMRELKQVVDLDQLIAATAGELGFILTLDEKRMVNLPVGNEILEFPEPGLILAIKIKDDTIPKFIDEKCQAGQLPLMREDVGGIQMTILPLQPPLPFEVKPTLATVDGYFLIASNPAQMRQVIDVKKGRKKGLTATAEFQQLRRDVPLEGNMFGYVSPRFGKTVANAQKAIVAGMQDRQPEQAGIMVKINELQKLDELFSFGVGQVRQDGIYTVGYTSVSGAQAIVSQVVVMPSALILALALPALEKAQVKAKRVNAAGNLKQIGLACMMYSGQNNGDFPAPDGHEGLNELVKRDIVPIGKVFLHPNDPRRRLLPDAKALIDLNCSYAYIGAGYKDDDREASKTPLVFEKPGIEKGFVNVFFLDGHAEGLEGTVNSCVDVIELLHVRKQFSEPRYKSLMSKAKRLDQGG